MDKLNIIMLVGTIILVIVSLIQSYRIENGKGKKKILKLDNFCEKHYKKVWIFFVLIFIVTVAYKFGELPNSIGVDEAAGAYDASNIANYGGGQSVLLCYLAVLCIKIFGNNIFAYRLPFLLIYIITIIVSYLFVSKSKNKKMALLFTFLIITCPWNIISTRKALDCNLYGGMLMINLFLMNRAKKNYQYILAGISVGITLYSYSLSWITMPIFLGIWAIYMLYINKITIKQLILFSIPIIVLAIPLLYFLLVNYGIAQRTKFGIFTVPKLPIFRNSEIAISNIWTSGLESLKVIFINKGTIYLMCVPLFIIGYMTSIKELIQNIKQKEYSITSVMVIAFTTILMGLLTASIQTANKANALYIPILYFVMIGILEIFKNSKTLLIIYMTFISLSFICFEYSYYTNDAYHIDTSARFDDNSFYKIVEKLEANEEMASIKKRVFIYKFEPDIYQLYATQMSPYEYNEKAVKKLVKGKEIRSQIGKYHYYTIEYNLRSLWEEVFKSENEIVIVSEILIPIIEGINENKEYEKIKYEDVYIFANKNLIHKLERILQK